MKKISLQWRITIMTSLLIAISCISINLLMFRSGSNYMDSLEFYVNDYSQNSENGFYINIPDDKMDSFLDKFSDQIYKNKLSLNKKGWMLTGLVSILSGILAYYVSGKSLEPLKELSENIEQIQIKNLSDSKLEEVNIKEFERLVSSFNDMLERLSASFKNQREFTANAAHELKTPLAIIQSQIDLYEEDNDSLSLESKEFLSMLKSQISKLNTIIASLLDLSELESIKRQNKIELSSLIDEIIDDLYPLLDKNKIKISNKICKDLYILGSDTLIYRLFYNLIENAIKYNRENGKIEVWSETENSFIDIFVKDYGIGMDQEDLKNIFNPFYRSNNKKSSVDGSGLGLALVDGIAKVHKAEISVSSKINEGSVFKIKFNKLDK